VDTRERKRGKIRPKEGSGMDGRKGKEGRKSE